MAKPTPTKSDSTSVAVTSDDTPRFSAELVQSNTVRMDVDWSTLTSVQDILAATAAAFGDIVDISEFSDGFVKVEKETLVGHAIVILDSVLVDKDPAQGKIGNYVVVRVLDTTDGVKKVFSDGGTGIFEQMVSLISKTGRRGGFGIPNGLRYSDYTYTDKDGDQVPARTYYLDDSPAA